MQYKLINKNELYHYGIKGQKRGTRRFQNADGSLTAEGIQRYRSDSLNKLRSDANNKYEIANRTKTSQANQEHKIAMAKLQNERNAEQKKLAEKDQGKVDYEEKAKNKKVTANDVRDQVLSIIQARGPEVKQLSPNLIREMLKGDLNKSSAFLTKLQNGEKIEASDRDFSKEKTKKEKTSSTKKKTTKKKKTEESIEKEDEKEVKKDYTNYMPKKRKIKTRSEKQSVIKHSYSSLYGETFAQREYGYAIVKRNK